jgi:hypothetical protein
MADVKALLLAAALGGAGGAGAVLLASAIPAPAPPSRAGAAAPDALAAALASLEVEVGALRREIAEGREHAPARDDGGVGGADGPTRPGPAGPAKPKVPAEVSAARAPAAAGPPAASPGERLLPLRGWQKDPDVRARWTFLDEKEVLERFGTPDMVTPEGSTERWHYRWRTGERDEDGNEMTDEMLVVLNRGRLVQVYE